MFRTLFYLNFFHLTFKIVFSLDEPTKKLLLYTTKFNLTLMKSI